MKKNDVFDTDINPDGISNEISDLDEDIFDRGYCCETDDGTWYEVFVSENIKNIHENIDLDNPDYKRNFSGFHDLELEMYEDYGQITFFVPNDEQEYTLDKIVEIFY